MTIASCPRCQEEIRVPAGIPADAKVQCPLCREEYSLAEPLAKLPPELLVVDSLVAPTVNDRESDVSWDMLEESPDQAQPANEFAFAPAAGGAKSAFDFESGDADGPSPVSSVRASARRAKPKGSPIKSILSIAIGGMLAFPIAQLILWYLPGDLKRDFGAGPVVAKYLPLIVPAKFRGKETDNSDSESPAIPDFNAGGFSEFSANTSNTDSQGDQKQRPKKQRPSSDSRFGGGGFELPDTEGSFAEAAATTIQDVANSDGSEASDSDTELPGVELPGVDVPGVDVPEMDVPAINLPGIDLPTVAPPKLSLDPSPAVTDEPESEATEKPPVPTPPIPEPEGSPPVEKASEAGRVKEGPVYVAAQVAEAFSTAQAASDAWDDAGESAVTGTHKSTFCRSLARLGETLAFGAEPSDQRSEASTLLDAVGKHASKIQAIAALQRKWIDLPHATRGSDGICLHGAVASVAKRGELYETVVENNEWSIPVITRDDPSETLKEGQQVLVLGAIVAQPADRLVGYKGDAEVLILGGLHVAIEQE